MLCHTLASVSAFPGQARKLHGIAAEQEVCRELLFRLAAERPVRPLLERSSRDPSDPATS